MSIHLFLTFVLVAASHAAREVRASSPEILVHARDPVIVGDPVTVTLRGFTPGETVRLTAEMRDRERSLLRSWADFRVGAEGSVDVAKEAPLAGTWTEADAVGPFWSMTRVDGATPDASEWSDPAAADVTLRALRGEAEAASVRVARWRARPGVTRVDVREGGLVASLHLPPEPGRHAAVMLVGGSSGGIRWQREAADLFASHGYASLALAYFDMEGLPNALDGIPLEYFHGALAWLRARPEVDPDRVALCGVSKGGELALLLASRSDAVKGVIAYVPASHVFQSINAAGGRPLTSSWTEAGKPLPFVPYSRDDARLDMPLTELYRLSLEKASAETLRLAAIPVETIRGPVLLVSGRADSIWPSTPMCDAIVKRLAEARFAHGVQHLAYDDADHSLSATGWTPVPEVLHGGTRAALARARADAWPKVLAFLRETIGTR